MTVSEKNGDLEPTYAPVPSPASEDQTEPAPTDAETVELEIPAGAPSPAAAESGGGAKEPNSRAAEQPGTKSERRVAKPKKMSRSRQARLASLYRAFRSGRSVEGVVEGLTKGGYEIRLGKTRAFCPHSQIDLDRVEQPEKLVGEKLAFRITQIRRGGEDIVVSRRAILEEERREEAKAVRATLIEGAVMQGHVAGLAEFGAFVDLGAGVMGLVHVSELAHTRVTRVADAVKVGDVVRVKILKLNERDSRISLSIRQAEADPWVEVAERFVVGKTYPGVLVRLADFGAFVEMAPGIEALAPASEFPPSRPRWSDGLEVGAEREWLVLSVDASQHRISITPPVEGVPFDGLPPLEVGKTFRGKVQRVEKFGVFVWLGPGRVGLMPNAWTGAPRGENLDRRFPIGEEVEVDLVELSGDGRRIRLAKTGVDLEAEGAAPGGRRASKPSRKGPGGRGAPAEKYEPKEPGDPFGTILADKLRAALDRSSDSS